MAWLALCWKLFGQSPVVTRCAMLLLAAFSLLGFFRLARTVANSAVAIASTILVGIYPVFFAQSSLAQIDLPSAGFIFWGLESYFQDHREMGARAFLPVRTWGAVFWFSLAALAKETAILVPLALFLSEMGYRGRAALQGRETAARMNQPPSAGYKPPAFRRSIVLLLPTLPLALWYAYHYSRTRHVFGNAEFFRYNVESTLRPLRIFLAFLLRLWQTVGYLDLYVLTIACLLAMMFPPLKDAHGERPRIQLSIQFSFLAIILAYVLILSVIGGAVLARYLLPVVPLVTLVCVSTIWRRLRAWKAVIVVIALAFGSALFVNPPYGFSPEDNLAYRDYIHLHQRAEYFLEQHYPSARVLTAWPASDELTHPYLGYVRKPLRVVRIDDFSAEQLLSAADARSRFDVALVFSTKYQPRSIFDRWRKWQMWKTRYFGFHVDLPPEIAASVLDGRVVYLERRGGQWIGIIELPRIEEARDGFNSANGTNASSRSATPPVRARVPASRVPRV